MSTSLYLTWSDDFSQDGDLIIDEQDRAIVATINKLH